MALNFDGLPTLVRWLADKHHHGSVNAMAPRVGVSPAAVAKWVRGLVKNPEISSLYQLADAYHLNRSEVIEVAMRPPKRGRRGLACWVAILAAAGMVSGDAWAATSAPTRSSDAPMGGILSSIWAWLYQPWGVGVSLTPVGVSPH